MSNYRIRISAKGFFFNKKGEVLLAEGKRSNKGNRYYCAPGGGVEEGETLKVAVERELIEETGYCGVAKRIVYCQDYDNPDYSRNFEVFFVGSIDETKKRISEGDHKSQFISKEEFSNIILYPKGIDPFVLKEVEGIDYNPFSRFK